MELFGMAFIINLMINAFYGYVMWYFSTFGKFKFEFQWDIPFATINGMFSDVILPNIFVWLFIGIFTFFPFYHSSENYYGLKRALNILANTKLIIFSGHCTCFAVFGMLGQGTH